MKTLLKAIVGIYLGITTTLSMLLMYTIADEDYRQKTFDYLDNLH